MSNVWFTSDLHIGHAKIAELRSTPAVKAAFPPEAWTQWHDRVLANFWDATVKPDDTVWVLGDISAGGSAAQARALSWITERPGWKHLITGNHDGCHPMHRDAHKWQTPLPDAGIRIGAAVRASAHQRPTSSPVALPVHR